MTRVAVVTGAARGIGAATVRRLAAEGYAVMAIDRAADDPRLPYRLGSPAQLEALGSEHPTVEVRQVDVTDVGALGAAVADAQTTWGGLDVFVAAAGVIGGGVPLWEMPAAELDAVLAGNLGTALVSARVAVPALLARAAPRHGRFIAVASTAASRGLPMLAGYCAAKAGIVGMIRALALELRGTGVTAVAVSPGSTRTPILDQSAVLYGLAGAEAFAAQQPIERLIEPEEIAATIAWLATAGADAVTGTEVAVDGGLSL
jgi:SDR family mycofactocin-dependent oxidoreductase